MARRPRRNTNKLTVIDASNLCVWEKPKEVHGFGGIVPIDGAEYTEHYIEGNSKFGGRLRLTIRVAKLESGKPRTVACTVTTA